METTTSNTAAPSVEVPRLVRACCKQCGCELLRPKKALNRAICELCKAAKHRDKVARYFQRHPEVKQAQSKRAAASAKKQRLEQGRNFGSRHHREKMSAIQRLRWAALSEDKKEEIRQQLKQNDWRIGMEKMQQILKDPKVQAARIEGIRNSPKAKAAAHLAGKRNIVFARTAAESSPKCQKGEQHGCAKRWVVRAPNRVVYDFVCAAEFIRTHSDLFDESDLVWKGSRCRALAGLSSLRPDVSRTKGSWKGWQWVSTQEWLVGNNDLLSATAHSPNAEAVATASEGRLHT